MPKTGHFYFGLTIDIALLDIFEGFKLNFVDRVCRPQYSRPPLAGGWSRPVNKNDLSAPRKFFAINGGEFQYKFLR
jgi:hypothetical protein